jgi:hypothetical protein
MNLSRSILAVMTILVPVQFVSAQETSEEKAMVARRDAFLRQNFTNFALVQFLPPTNETETVLQRFKVNDHLIGEFEGVYWSGIRFTVPNWTDGDFEWMFLHDHNAATRRSDYQWYILPERGQMRGFTNFTRMYLTNYAGLKARFPGSTRAHVQRLGRQEFKPAETYAIWWAHANRVVADIVFGLTIDSERGHKEFGALPLKLSPSFARGCFAAHFVYPGEFRGLPVGQI